MTETYSPKNVPVGEYNYKRADWGDVTVPVSVITEKTGELGVVFSKGFGSILMKNMPDGGIFTSKKPL